MSRRLRFKYEFKHVEDVNPFRCIIKFKEPLILYDGDEFTMEYDNLKVISLSVKRKNSS